MNDHLTEPNPELARAVRNTPHGMMHWASTGPDGSTCGKCQHYGYDYENNRGKFSHRSRACELFYKRMGRHPESALPEATPGCKYFEPKPQST